MTQNLDPTPNALAVGKMPAQIKIALAILSLVLLSEIVLPLVLMSAGGGLDKGFLEILLIFFLLSGSSLLMIVILVFVGLRHDWARWVWLVLTIVGVLFSFSTLVMAKEWAAFIVIEQIENAFDILGTSLLFFGSGGRWFKRDAPA